MTKKRFTIKEFSTLDAMSSLDVICDNGIELPSSTACDLLNALHEENVKLQARNKYLATKIQRERNSTQKQYAKWEKEAETKIKELLEENEQLKHDATVIIQANQDYRRENEQLKSFIQKLTEQGCGKIVLANGNVYNVNAILTDMELKE